MAFSVDRERLETVDTNTSPLDISESEPATPEVAMADREPSILDLNNDVLLLICHALDREIVEPRAYRPAREPPPRLSTLKAFSMTCKRLRELTAPLVFHGVEIGGFRCNWEDVRRVLTSMERSQLAKRHTKRFCVRVYISPSYMSDIPAPESHPDEALFIKLAALLQSMQKLEKVSFTRMGVPDEQYSIMATVLQKSLATLTSVKWLSIPSRLTSLVQKCPNMTFLNLITEKDDTESLLDAIQYSPALKQLDCHTAWTPDLLAKVHELTPDLHSLTMHNGGSRWARTHPIFDFAPVLSTFTNLKTLQLSPLDNLGVGFHPSRCGNSYQGPGGAQRLARMRADEERLSKKVANAMFGKCKALEDLRIGGFGRWGHATCVRGEDGDVQEVKWISAQETPSG